LHGALFIRWGVRLQCGNTVSLPPMQQRSVLQWIIFIALALTWGSSFILMKRGLDVYTPEQVAALRIGIAFLFLLPLAFRYFRSINPKPWAALAGMGITGNLIPAFLFTKAETMISSSLTGMLNSLTPLFTLLVGLSMFKRKTNGWQVAGTLIGLAGALALIATGRQDEHPGNVWLGSVLVVIATFFYGISVNIIKAKLDGVNAVGATVLALCIIGPVALGYLFTTDFVHRLTTHPQALQSLMFVCVLAVFGTALSVIVYNMLIRDAGPLFASSVAYLIPAVAIGWGMTDGEAFGMLPLLCIGVILTGVWMVNRK
jgi:drug/metabolite transporter (DMT)-like permease